MNKEVLDKAKHKKKSLERVEARTGSLRGIQRKLSGIN